VHDSPCSSRHLERWSRARFRRVHWRLGMWRWCFCCQNRWGTTRWMWGRFPSTLPNRTLPNLPNRTLPNLPNRTLPNLPNRTLPYLPNRTLHQKSKPLLLLPPFLLLLRDLVANARRNRSLETTVSLRGRRPSSRVRACLLSRTCRWKTSSRSHRLRPSVRPSNAWDGTAVNTSSSPRPSSPFVIASRASWFISLRMRTVRRILCLFQIHALPTFTRAWSPRHEDWDDAPLGRRRKDDVVVRRFERDTPLFVVSFQEDNRGHVVFGGSYSTFFGRRRIR